MRVLKWIGIGLLVVVAAVAGFLVVSTAVDALMGGDRVATRRPRPADSAGGASPPAQAAAGSAVGSAPACSSAKRRVGRRLVGQNEASTMKAANRKAVFSALSCASS